MGVCPYVLHTYKGHGYVFTTYIYVYIPSKSFDDDAVARDLV